GHSSSARQIRRSGRHHRKLHRRWALRRTNAGVLSGSQSARACRRCGSPGELVSTFTAQRPACNICWPFLLLPLSLADSGHVRNRPTVIMTMRQTPGLINPMNHKELLTANAVFISNYPCNKKCMTPEIAGRLNLQLNHARGEAGHWKSERRGWCGREGQMAPRYGFLLMVFP